MSLWRISPWRLTIIRRTIGRRINKTAKSAGGKTPLIIAKAGLNVSVGTERPEDRWNLPWQFTNPREEGSITTECVDIGDDTDKGDGDSPDDDQPNGQSPRDDGSDLSLIRVHLQVAPFDVFGYDLDTRLYKSEALVGRRDQSSESMSLGLRSESDKGSVSHRVLFGVLSELVEFFVVLSNVGGGGLESHLCAKQAEESLFPGRLLLLENESVGKVIRGLGIILA